MPTYTVATTRSLTREMRQSIADAIANVHSRVTGADRVFAQVVFVPRSPDIVIVGGAPADEDHIFVDATIRAGRTTALVDELIDEVAGAVASAAGIHPRSIWLYIRELDASRMVEYGSVLPQPGEEDAWLREALGATRPATSQNPTKYERGTRHG